MIQSLKLTQFKNFTFQSFTFSSKAVAFTGLNGVGKTNLLDAIYYICYTKSNFQSKEKYNIQHGTEGFRLEAQIIDQAADTDQVTCILKEGKKTFLFNQVPYEKLSQHIGKYAAIIIAPDDTELINGTSEVRRKFIDGLIANMDQQYLEYLMQYQKIVQQRNAYLKNTPFQLMQHSLLDVYDQQMVHFGTYLIEKRSIITALLPQYVSKYYNVLTKAKETANIQYKQSATTTDFYTTLVANRSKDIMNKRTSIGPHTDDWELFIKDTSCKIHASQGQKKSYLISLKLAQLSMLNERGIQPFLLLDDIYEKLDRERLAQFFQMLGDFQIRQIFMTHTTAADINIDMLGAFDQIEIICL